MRNKLSIFLLLFLFSVVGSMVTKVTAETMVGIDYSFDNPEAAAITNYTFRYVTVTPLTAMQDRAFEASFPAEILVPINLLADITVDYNYTVPATVVGGQNPYIVLNEDIPRGLMLK